MRLSRPCALFLSPHLDDVGFSLPCCVRDKTQSGWRCVVATVFSSCGDAPSGDIQQRYHARRTEDAQACAMMGAEPLHLGLRDAPFRDPRLDNYLAIVFAEAQAHATTAHEVATALEGLLAAEVDEIWAPLAVGGHIDHRLVHEAARNVAQHAGIRLSYYEDRPYAFSRWLQAARLRELGWVDGAASQPQPAQAWEDEFLASPIVQAYLPPGPAREETLARMRSAMNGTPAAQIPVSRQILRPAAGLDFVVAVAACYAGEVQELFGGPLGLRAAYEMSACDGDGYRECAWAGK